MAEMLSLPALILHRRPIDNSNDSLYQKAMNFRNVMHLNCTATAALGQF